MRSKYCNESIFVYNSVRKPGYVYKFAKHKRNSYRCCRCRELGKDRTITVEIDKVVGRKNPEGDHHRDCEPIAQDVVLADKLDRDMRNEVGLNHL